MNAATKNLIAVGLLVIASARGWAQEAGGAPQSGGEPSTVAARTEVPEPPVAANEFSPGSGAQTLGLGFGGKRQLDIGLSFNQSWDSNAGVVPGSQGDWNPVSAFGGFLELTRESRTNRTLLSYNGNSIVYTDRDPSWTTYHNLGFSQNFKVGRWGFTVADNVNYSPNSPYGGFGSALGGISAFNGSSILKPQYVPNQSILTPTTASYSNSVLGQVEYGLSRRSSWTVTGSYGFLRYPDSGFFNTNQISASTGYNYSLSAKDAISLTYNYNRFGYTEADSDFATQNVQFGYSHLLAGRMSFQASGGIEFIDSSNMGESLNRIRFSGNGSLNYKGARTSLGLSYFAGSTGGSGVLNGAGTQSVEFRLGQEFTRNWTGALSVGYSHNSGLFQAQSYDTLYASPGLRRAVTRNLGLTFNYTYQRQLTSSSCVASACGTLARNLLTFGFDYRFRPIRLE